MNTKDIEVGKSYLIAYEGGVVVGEVVQVSAKDGRFPAYVIFSPKEWVEEPLVRILHEGVLSVPPRHVRCPDGV